MTRFELADRLSKGLYLLEEGEKHNVINMYISDVNRAVEAGADEGEEIAKLGDIDTLITNILKSYHIEIPEEAPAQPKEEVSEQTKVAQEATEQDGYFTHKLKEHRRKKNIESMNKGKDTGILRKAAGGLWNFTKDFTFNLINIFVFIFIWMPCMAVTAAGIICTVFVTVMYVFGGIGFLGICIAGFGCCIVGISFCGWLLGAMGGKKYE